MHYTLKAWEEFVGINLKKDVFEIRIARKESMGFSSKTHSDFGRPLLLNFFINQLKQSLQSLKQSLESSSPHNN